MAKKSARRISVTQVKSGIGTPARQRATLEALGFKRHQQTVIHDDTPAIRGMIAKIPHLVSVDKVKE